MTSRPTHNPLGHIRKLLVVLAAAAALVAGTAVPAKADGITLTVQPPGSSMQLVSKSCYSSYYWANNRWEKYCLELYAGTGGAYQNMKQQQVDLYWDGGCWRQYELYYRNGLGLYVWDAWRGPVQLVRYCYSI